MLNYLFSAENRNVTGVSRTVGKFILIKRLAVVLLLFCMGVSKVNLLNVKRGVSACCVYKRNLREVNLNKTIFYFCLVDVESESGGSSSGASAISLTRSEG